jgi:ribosomal protein L11 methylase PrmA
LDRVLYVKSGAAFPPGHPTTRLCLDLLREALAAASVKTLLDVGCGTGLLAWRLRPWGWWGGYCSGGARYWRKRRANGLAGSLRVVRGSTECVKGPFDLVAANLPWEVQMEKVSELDRLAALKGRLILSGFRDNQENRLIERYQRLGWSLDQRVVKDFWHPELPPEISFTWVAWLLAR